jgi:hypothetical protein
MRRDVVIYDRNPLWLWGVKFLFWLVVMGLLVFAFTSCGTTAGWVGIASIDALNEESAKVQEFAREEAKARQEATHAAIVASVAPLDIAFPNLSQSVAATLAGAPYKPTPDVPERDDPSDNLPPWSTSLAEVGAAVALSYFWTNAARDRARRKRGEALTAEEAKAKGYFEEGVARAG